VTSAATKQQFAMSVGFCDRCIAQTTSETPGNIHSVNGIGTMLSASRWYSKEADRCSQCGSVVQIKWISFGVGLKPLGTYRVLYVKKGVSGFTASRFFARRLANDPFNFSAMQAGVSATAQPPAQSQSAETGQLNRAQSAAINPSVLASFPARVAALLLDVVISGLLCAPLMALVEAGSRRASAPADIVMSSSLGLMFLVQLFYFAGLESSTGQATWGKRLLHLKVCNVQMQKITFARAMGRYCLKFLSGAIYGIGFLIALFTKQKQALHDLACGTLVING
jgi:uncharacterized RDD family membrane protein YckC